MSDTNTNLDEKKAEKIDRIEGYYWVFLNKEPQDKFIAMWRVYGTNKKAKLVYRWFSIDGRFKDKHITVISGRLTPPER